MNILLVAATPAEIAPCTETLQKNGYQLGHHTISTLITGVGSLSTGWQLATAFPRQLPGLAIQAGIGGSFSEAFPPGAVVLVNREYIGDTGVEEDHSFRDLFDMGLQQAGEFPFTGRALVNPALPGETHYGLPVVSSVTISEITTRPSRVEQLQQKYAPVVEAMEGAAFHYACLRQQLPFLQLRAISNFVGERDKRKWKMKAAIDALNDTLVSLLSHSL